MACQCEIGDYENMLQVRDKRLKNINMYMYVDTFT